MKRTTKKQFKWLLSDKPEKLRKRIAEIIEEFINMILNDINHEQQNKETQQST